MESKLNTLQMDYNPIQQSAINVLFQFDRTKQDVLTDFLRSGRLVFTVTDYVTIEVLDLTNDEVIDLWGSRRSVYDARYGTWEEIEEWGEPHPEDAVQWMRDNIHRCGLYVDYNHMTESLMYIITATTAGMPVMYLNQGSTRILAEINRDVKQLFEELNAVR